MELVASNNFFWHIREFAAGIVCMSDQPFVRGSIVRNFNRESKLYIPSTLNIDLILWHTQLIVCAENVRSWFK